MQGNSWTSTVTGFRETTKVALVVKTSVGVIIFIDLNTTGEGKARNLGV